ncbi:proline-rich extensin-like protein EPR1 [Archocentrus centrarchus]|uniref:proline-rich extensin-like protein EPR1 n=1 Tax=Archocentrus centrarchus TaxID=63155 RepID=UPI0011EA23E5|nr:proline-rich extensin-like protein EPR1 [Archocentrus centrarchus]
MKKGSLNFLSRKNHSLFDTDVKRNELENVELLLGPTATPESGTASVRARPTVKHHASSSESFQGFAVPTPKVPLLPPVNGPKINGSVGGGQLSNGFVTSVPDLDKEEIFVPPCPSVAPPPPPNVFIPPPPDFLGDLNSLDPATLQPPSMPAPNPPSVEPKEEDLSFLKRPPMAPPKPPSTSSTGSASSIPISSLPTAQVPEHPKFAAPQPPTERRQKTQKTPPPKPIRVSSVSSLDSPPHSPAPPPPVQAPTLSTFNPQHRAKINSTPKTSFYSGLEDREKKSNHLLILEDSGTANSIPVLVQADGNASKVAAPSKPVPNDVQELKKNLQVAQPSESPPPEQKTEAKTETISAEITNPVLPPPQKSPQLEGVEKVNSTPMNLEPIKDKPGRYQSPDQKFSPLLDRKLHSLKGNQTHGARDGHAASPLALLQAAKEREKHRSTHSLSQDSSAKKNDKPSIHPSEKILPETPEYFSPIQHPKTNDAPENSSSHALVNGQVPSTSPALNNIIETPTVSKIAEQRQNAYQSNSQSQSAQPQSNKEISMPLLPPPPEFDDLTKIMELPPSFCPPDPPTKKAPLPPISSLSPGSVQSPLNTTQPSLSPTSSASVLSSPLKTAPAASAPAPPVKTAPAASVPAPPVKTAPAASVPAPPVKTAPAASVSAPPLKTAPAASVPAPPVKTAPAASVPAPPVKTAPAASVSAPPLKTAPAASVPAPPLKTAPAASVPAPPVKTAPAASVPAPPLKTAPAASIPAPPPLNPPPPSAQPKSQIQTKPRADPSQSGRTLEQRHFDLQCILKKKLEEMAPKMSHQKEDAEPPSDEWEASDQLKPSTPNYQHKAGTLDMTELQRKVEKKYQDNSSTKGSISNGPKSKYQHGMTFTVRPGTKNPITYYE